MRHSWSRILGVAALAAATFVVIVGTSAQERQQRREQKALELRGKVVRTSPEQIIVQTNDNKEVAIQVSAQTKFMLNNRAIKATEIRTGANITAAYVLQGDRYIANMVTLVDAQARGRATVIEGQVAKVVGKDQVLVTTIEGKEIPVVVTPQTVIEFNARPVQFTQLRVGTPIAITYDLRGRQYVATKIVGVTALEGKVVRVVGDDQVILSTSDGKEVVVYTSADTRYRVTDAGGAFVDLRPGTMVNVYYDVRDRRNMARHIFRPIRRR